MTTLYGREARDYLSLSASNQDIDDADEQKHVNDNACGDKRGRLYIIKKADAVLFHCHNCGTSGHFTVRNSWKRIEEAPGAHMRTGGVATLNVNVAHRKDISTDGALWLAQYEMSDLRPIAEHDNRLWIPVTHGDVLVGEQGRLLVPQEVGGVTRPKYITRFLSTPCLPKTHPDTSVYGSVSSKFSFGRGTNVNSPLFIVEDLLSGYKIQKAGGTYLSMLGTSLNIPTYLQTLAAFGYSLPTSCVVWLDPDLAGTAAGVELYTELYPLFTHTELYMPNAEPKEISLETLKGIVNARSRSASASSI